MELTVTDADGNVATATKEISNIPPPSEYTLAVNSVNGNVISNPDQVTYTHGDTVTLIAIADTGYKFSNWSDDASGSSPSTTVTMTEDKTVTANFTPDTPETYSLTLTGTHGSIIKTPDHSSYAYNETVTLKAIPYSGYRFTGWSGGASGTSDTVMITIKGDTSVTAMFETAAYTVDIAVSPTSSGNVHISPDKSGYSSGETIALNAEAASGSNFVFDHWEGDYSGSRAAVTLPVTKDLDITAVFVSTNELAITPSVLETIQEDSELLTAAGGVEPYTWSATSGNLTPDTGPKVSYQAPAAPGTSVVTVSDNRGITTVCNVIVYSELNVSPSVHTMEIADSPDEIAEFEISGGKEPYTVSVTDGSASAVENKNFVYSSPDEAGKVTLTIKDALGQQVSAAVTVTKSDPLTVTPESITLRPGENAGFTAAGGSPKYTWKADAGQLLATEGKTVTYVAPDVSSPAATPYKITVSDKKGNSASVDVRVINSLNITPQVVSIVLGDGNAVDFKASGGASPFRWEAESGIVNGTGVEISYKPPAQQGEYDLTLKDSEDTSVKALIRVVSVPRVTPASRVLSINETVSLSVSGGKAPYSWAAESGELAQTEGKNVGYTAPNVNGLFIVKVRDAFGHESKCQIKVVGNLIITPLKSVVAIGETVNLAAARGVEPYTWPDTSEGRTWSTSYNQVGRNEVVVTDAAGDNGLSVVEVINSALGVTPSTARLHPGEVVNFFVTGGTSPYSWTAEAESLSNLEGDRVGYVAPDSPGKYEITVVDGRDVYGRATVHVTAGVIGLDGTVRTDRGSIRSGIVVDGISCPGRKVLVDQESHLELSFPLEIPDDGRPYNTYGALIYTTPDGTGLMLFRKSSLFNPFVEYSEGDFPVYMTGEPGSTVVVDFYRGQLKGLPGTFQFFVASAPEGTGLGDEFIFNAEPYVVEVK